MNMKKIVIALVCLVVGSLWFVSKKKIENKPVIAILQIASHAALDASRQAFIDVIKEKTGDTYSIVIKNADGSVANAQTIAQSLTSRSDVVALYALGTPALQALVQKEAERPVFFSAVTYPSKLGLMRANVAGTSDYFDLQELITFSRKLVPNAVRVGILYNPGTEIAQHEISVLEGACRHHGLVPVRIAGVTEADILGAVKSNLRKVDVCVVPTDNMIASVLSSIAAMCKQENIPLVAAWQTALKDGVLAAFGMDYCQLGRSVGLAAAYVLNGHVKVGSVGVLHAQPHCVLNNDVAVVLSKTVSINLAACKE